MLLASFGNEIAGAATVNNSFVYADDDINCATMGKIAHPENITNSYSWYLAKQLGLSHKSLSSDYQTNQEIYHSFERFVTKTLPTIGSNYTVLVVGWFPDNRGEFDAKACALCEQYNTQYCSFDLILDFVDWCRNNDQLNQYNYPTREAHHQWANQLFEKIIDNH